MRSNRGDCKSDQTYWEKIHLLYHGAFGWMHGPTLCCSMMSPPIKNALFFSRRDYKGNVIGKREGTSNITVEGNFNYQIAYHALCHKTFCSQGGREMVYIYLSKKRGYSIIFRSQVLQCLLLLHYHVTDFFFKL